MSTSLVRDQQAWEYRRLFVIPYRHQQLRSTWKRSNAGFVENLVETIEGLERARAEGWKLLSVKIEEDDHGRCWLNSYMKRPKSVDKPLPRLDIERAA